MTTKENSTNNQGIVINNSNIPKFKKRMQAALKELGYDLSSEKTAEVFAKTLGKKSITDLKKALDKVSEKAIPQYTMEQKNDFFKEISTIDFTKKDTPCGVNSYEQKCFLLKKALNYYNQTGKPERSLIHLEERYAVIKKSEVSHDFFEKFRTRSVKNSLDTMDILNMTKWVEENDIKIYDHLNAIKEDYHSEEYIVLILFEFAPKNIFTGEALIKEYYNICALMHNYDTDFLLFITNINPQDDKELMDIVKLQINGSSFIELAIHLEDKRSDDLKIIKLIKDLIL